MTKALSRLQSSMKPSQESLRQERNRSDCKVALPYTSEQSTAPAAAAADLRVQKSSGKLSRAVDGAIGLISPYT